MLQNGKNGVKGQLQVIIFYSSNPNGSYLGSNHRKNFFVQIMKIPYVLMCFKQSIS